MMAERIARVMETTGMAELQARRHVQSRDILCTRLQNDPNFLRKHVALMRRDRRGPARPSTQ